MYVRVDRCFSDLTLMRFDLYGWKVKGLSHDRA
jgi:hypothetical protein